MEHFRLIILLATYNGEKYLRQQLDSLLGQTYKDWVLYAHDDGSADTTLSILNAYAAKDSRVRILEDGVKGLGAAQNFMHLLKNAPEADFIMFCDQDDIWLPEKIEVMLQHINSAQPSMSYCNANSYKGEQPLPERVILFRATTVRDTLFLNGGIHGCLQIINKALRDIVVGYNGYVCMHDHLITLAAVSFGTVTYVDQNLMYYRQHSGNVTIGYETNIFRKAKKFLRSTAGVIDREHYKATVGFYEHYKTKMNRENQQLFLAYIQFPQSRLLKRILILLKCRFKIGRTSSILFLKIITRVPLGTKK